MLIVDLKYTISPQISKFSVEDMLFYDVDGFSTLKLCEKKIKNHYILGRASHFMVKGHSMDTRNILGIQGAITLKIMRMGGVGLYLYGRKTL